MYNFLYTYNGTPCFLTGKNEQVIPRLSGLPYTLLAGLNVYQDGISGQKPGYGILLSPWSKPIHCHSGSWYSPGSTSAFFLGAEPPWFSLFRLEKSPGAQPSRCMETPSKPVRFHISNLFSGWVGNQMLWSDQQVKLCTGNHRHIRQSYNHRQ